MLPTSARLLRLLSLLQQRREVTGGGVGVEADLAAVDPGRQLGDGVMGGGGEVIDWLLFVD